MGDVGTFYPGMLSTISHQVIRYARRVRIVSGAVLWEYYCTYPFDHTLADTRLDNRRCCGYSALQATGLARYTIQHMILRVLCYEMWERLYFVCHLGGGIMGQWGKTRTYPWVRYTPGIGYPGTPSLATWQPIETPSHHRVRTEARPTTAVVL